MKIRSGFVSNSSSSSFVIALPKTYKLSEEEMEAIRNEIEDWDEYFSHYEELAQETGNTEILDEREKIQKMLDTGVMTEEDSDPVTDEIKNADIQKGLEYLTTTSCIWMDELFDYDINIPTWIAAKAIFYVIRDKVNIGSFEGGADGGQQVMNILSDAFKDKEAIKLIKESFINEN